MNLIKLYGAERCHKTKYYQKLFKDWNVEFKFLDVEKDENFDKELRRLYKNSKLNFPTITIGTKKLRNPKKEELKKWLERINYLSID